MEEKVKIRLMERGFNYNELLNNRGLIGAVIEDTIIEFTKTFNVDCVAKNKQLSELESHYLTFESNLSNRGYSLRDKELLLQFFGAGNECGCMEHENIEDYFEQYYNETFK